MNLSLTAAQRVMLIVSSCIAVSSFDACATANMHGTSEDYEALLASGKTGVVMLSMDGCGHCKSAGPAFGRIAGQPEYKDVMFIELDGTSHPHITEKNDVRGFPSFLFIREGKVVNKEVGFDEGTFKRNLQDHMNGVAPMDTSSDSDAQANGVAPMDTEVDAMAPVHESHEEEGVLAKLKMLFVGLFEIIKNIFVTIFDWIMGLFGK